MTVLGLVIALTSAACSSSTPKGPEVASAADQSSYAETYPSRIESLTKELDDQETEARAIIASWEKIPAETGNTKDLDVRTLFEKADAAGKSSGYASERRDMNRVKAFFADEKDEIGRRVAGTVDHAAQQKGCEAKELGGAAAYGVKEAIDKRIEHRLRGSNEAQVMLDEEGPRVDKAVEDKLEKQLDDVATASFLVHVGFADTRRELAERRGDASKVQSTLDDAIKAENERAADSKRPEASKKVVKARLADLQKQRAAMDGVVTKANQSLETAEKRGKALEKEYDEKFKALLERLSHAK
jgi:hypothetical protein